MRKRKMRREYETHLSGKPYLSSVLVPLEESVRASFDQFLNFCQVGLVNFFSIIEVMICGGPMDVLISLEVFCTQSGMMTARSNSCTEIPRCLASFSSSVKFWNPTDSISFDIRMYTGYRAGHMKSCVRSTLVAPFFANYELQLISRYENLSCDSQSFETLVGTQKRGRSTELIRMNYALKNGA